MDSKVGLVYSAGQTSTIQYAESTRRHLAVWLFGMTWETPIQWELSPPAYITRVRFIEKKLGVQVDDGDSSSQETDLDAR